MGQVEGLCASSLRCSELPLGLTGLNSKVRSSPSSQGSPAGCAGCVGHGNGWRMEVMALGKSLLSKIGLEEPLAAEQSSELQHPAPA